MHGGVIFAMTAIRENYLIPRLQQIAKRVIRKCFACKRFYTKAFGTQQQGIIPSNRTTGIRPFQVVGTNISGPIIYCNKNKDRKKHTCSFSHAILQDHFIQKYCQSKPEISSFER